MRQSNDNGESNENCRFITTVISNDNVTVLKRLKFVAPIVTKIGIKCNLLCAFCKFCSSSHHTKLSFLVNHAFDRTSNYITMRSRFMRKIFHSRIIWITMWKLSTVRLLWDFILLAGLLPTHELCVWVEVCNHCPATSPAPGWHYYFTLMNDALHGHSVFFYAKKAKSVACWLLKC